MEERVQHLEADTLEPPPDVGGKYAVEEGHSETPEEVPMMSEAPARAHTHGGEEGEDGGWRKQDGGMVQTGSSVGTGRMSQVLDSTENAS